MNQKNPLLNYRIKCDIKIDENPKDMTYDMIEGLWKNKFGEPIIRKFIENNKLDASGQTLVTETREGTDRSEVSSVDKECLCNFIDKTIITATREGTDRTENSLYTSEYENTSNDLAILEDETMITRTRESVDRSESSHYEEYYMGSTITFTRESVDRSEKS